MYRHDRLNLAVPSAVATADSVASLTLRAQRYETSHSAIYEVYYVMSQSLLNFFLSLSLHLFSCLSPLSLSKYNFYKIFLRE